MNNKLVSAALGICSLTTLNLSQAAYLTESHSANSSLATSQYIDSVYFDDSFDRDINTENGLNISQDSLHASILGSGDGTVDYYSFNGLSGQAYFDIDYAYDFGGAFDSWIELYDSNGLLLASNDDSFIEAGSFHGFDSFLGQELDLGEMYYLAVGSYSGLSDIPFGANYTLHISQSVSAVPVPAAVWLFGSGLIALAGLVRRKA